jgi:hypothetical protein
MLDGVENPGASECPIGLRGAKSGPSKCKFSHIAEDSPKRFLLRSFFGTATFSHKGSLLDVGK